MGNDNFVYNDIILTFSIVDDETRLEFLHGLKRIKDIQIDGLTPSTYAIKAKGASSTYQEISRIITKMKFSKNDFIILACSTTFVSNNVEPKYNNKLIMINVDLP